MILLEILQDLAAILDGVRFYHLLLFIGKIFLFLELFLEGVKDFISISLVACREYDDLVVLLGCFEALVDVWTDIDTRLDRLALAKLNADRQVIWQIFDVIDAVYEGLIQVKYNRLLKWRWWQLHAHRLEYFRVWLASHFHIMKRLHRLY